MGAIFEEEEEDIYHHVQFSSRRPPGEVLDAVEVAAAALGGSARRHGDKRCAERRPPATRLLHLPSLLSSAGSAAVVRERPCLNQTLFVTHAHPNVSPEMQDGAIGASGRRPHPDAAGAPV